MVWSYKATRKQDGVGRYVAVCIRCMKRRRKNGTWTHLRVELVELLVRELEVNILGRLYIDKQAKEIIREESRNAIKR